MPHPVAPVPFGPCVPPTVEEVARRASVRTNNPSIHPDLDKVLSIANDGSGDFCFHNVNTQMTYRVTQEFVWAMFDVSREIEEGNDATLEFHRAHPCYEYNMVVDCLRLSDLPRHRGFSTVLSNGTVIKLKTPSPVLFGIVPDRRGINDLARENPAPRHSDPPPSGPRLPKRTNDQRRCHVQDFRDQPYYSVFDGRDSDLGMDTLRPVAQTSEERASAFQAKATTFYGAKLMDDNERLTRMLSQSLRNGSGHRGSHRGHPYHGNHHHQPRGRSRGQGYQGYSSDAMQVDG
ncbi:hypothetical protein ONZ45_g7378 [Pleurotus djamor]|nr:hypothetical protein ONZ45_g7378 [Pleurotus djamor]